MTDKPSPPFDHDPLRMWEYRGIWCAVYQARFCLTGYTYIPEGHLFRELPDYNALPVNVHGGLTYGAHHIEPIPEFRFKERKRSWEEVDWWVGFDTAHAWDTMIDKGSIISHWTVDEVVMETERLADQIADVSEQIEKFSSELNGSTDG